MPVRCCKCFALVPDGERSCPKCGGTSFIEAEGEGKGEMEEEEEEKEKEKEKEEEKEKEKEKNDSPVRRVHSFYSVRVLYAKPKPPIIVNGEPLDFPIEWRLLKVKPKLYGPSIFVWERDGLLTPGRPEAALSLVDAEDLAKILTALPQSRMEEIKRSLAEEWGVPLGKREDLASHIKDKFFQTVPRLRDPGILQRMDWRAYVEGLVCPKPGKDPILKAVHRAKISIPLAMKYAPHSIEVTNSGTGKSLFYDCAGILIAKATRRAVLGFAKSPNEVFPGTLHGTQLPTAFDQIESQDSYELAKYMFQLMETGRSLVDAGAFRFPVETGSSIAYLGNPLSKTEKAMEGFRALMEHISANPAIGRRFGIILFSTSLKPITGSEKMSLREEESWKESFTLFRAVEEYAKPRLQALIADAKVVEWLHKPIDGYRDAILKATEALEDPTMRLFFEAHAEAEHRVRGAALHTSVASLLDSIALGRASIAEILEEAEENLSLYVDINLQSIANLARLWDRLREENARAFFGSLSDYMQEIVSAVLHYRRANPSALTVDLASIPYEPENREAYPYFSKCIDNLKRRKRLEGLNEQLKDYFGFQLGKDAPGGGFKVQYFEGRGWPSDLRLLGKLGGGDFVISSISSFRSEKREAERRGEERERKGGRENEGEGEGEGEGEEKGKTESNGNVTVNKPEDRVPSGLKTLRNHENDEMTKSPKAEDEAEDESKPKPKPKPDAEPKEAEPGPEPSPISKNPDVSKVCGNCLHFGTQRCLREHPELIQLGAHYASECQGFTPRMPEEGEGGGGG